MRGGRHARYLYTQEAFRHVNKGVWFVYVCYRYMGARTYVYEWRGGECQGMKVCMYDGFISFENQDKEKLS